MKHFTLEEVAEQLKNTNCVFVEDVKPHALAYSENTVVYYLFVKNDGSFVDSSKNADLEFRLEIPPKYVELEAGSPDDVAKFRAEFEDMDYAPFTDAVWKLAERANAWFAKKGDWFSDDTVKELAKTIQAAGDWAEIEDETAELIRYAGLSDEWEAASVDWDRRGIPAEAIIDRAAEILGVEIY